MASIHHPDIVSRPGSPLGATPLSLYVHFPWCVRKCPYCDFNSHTLGRALDQSGYVDALIADLEFELGTAPQDRPILSIFLGGGTPSLFSPATIADFLKRAEAILRFSSDIEITMEANPGTTEDADFTGYRSAGINRLSIGVQSFNNGHLKKLGRIHGPEDAIRTVRQAHAAGLHNLNIDLMHGLPGQTPDEALDDIHRALSLEPAHVSAYQLTLEPNTYFHRYPPVLPEEASILAMQEGLQQALAVHGYQQYEVSAYAGGDSRCRHNLNYWEFGDYIGIGAGAHGKLTDSSGRIWRRSRKKHPATYLARAGGQEAIGHTSHIESDDRLLEYLMNALRLREGFAISQAAERTGLPESAFRCALQPAHSQGLVEISRGRIVCSKRGYRFIDTILSDLPDTGRGPSQAQALPQ